MELSLSLSAAYGVFTPLVFGSILTTSGFWPRVRGRALRAPVFLGSLPRPVRAPLAHRSFAAPTKIKNHYFQKQMLPFWPECGRQGRIFFYWAKLHPTELHCILLNYVAPF